MKRRLPLFIIAIISILAIIFNHTSTLSRLDKIENDPTTLPTFNITLANTTLSEINKTAKNIKYPDNHLSITYNNLTTDYTDIEIKGHGNSTWGWSKNPFQIKFNTKTNLFELGNTKEWILLANYLDKSYLRTDIAFFFERLLDEKYALNGQFVNLLIDNEPQGLYYLTKKTEIGKSQIDLRDDLGILVELDNLNTDKKQCFITAENSCLRIQDIVNKDNENQATSSFLSSFNALELAAKDGNYDLVKQLADTESFAKFFLLSDFTVNPDSFSSSLFFYKDGIEDKIHVGPGWDFDLSFGNQAWVWPRTSDYYLPETTRILEKYALGGTVYDEHTNETIELTSDKNISPLFFYMYQMPEFKNEVKSIYRHQIMNNKDAFIQYLINQANIIQTSAIEDLAIWKNVEQEILTKLEITDEIKANSILHSNMSIEDAFTYEVKSLINWIERRLDYLDREYSGFDSIPITFASHISQPTYLLFQASI